MTTHDTPPTLGGHARLGSRQVARVGFGAMQLERANDPARARHVLRAALAAGVDHIDTAAFYGDVNRWIADVLAGRSERPLLATKVGAEHADGRLIAAQRPEQLRAQVHANLTSLSVEQLDLVYLRRLDTPPGIIAEGEQIVDFDSQLAELTALRDAGLIAAIGLSSVSVEQTRAALPAGIVAVQNAYGVLDRTAEPVLALCREHGLAWIPYFPLGSAFPTRPKAHEDPTVQAIAQELAVSPTQVALAWLLAGYANTLLIPGTADSSHLQDNLTVGELNLPAPALAALTALTSGE
jgi:pyridoxine 4-dehydrogenase